MSTDVRKIYELIRDIHSAKVDLYQREYSWGLVQAKELFEDIIAAADWTNDKRTLRMGTMAIEEIHDDSTSAYSAYLPDGQQRYTTISLLMAAFTKITKNEYDTFQETLQTSIFEQYLINPHDPSKPAALTLKNEDDDTYKAIIFDHPLPPNASKKIVGNYQYFVDQLEAMAKRGEDRFKIWQGIKRLSVVVDKLDPLDDDPQEYFESVNSKGQPLKQHHHVTNYILMGIPHHERERIYKNYWQPLLDTFRSNENSKGSFDKFLVSFLLCKTKHKVNESNGYIKLRKWAERNEFDGENKKKLIKELNTYCQYYFRIVFDMEPDPDIKNAFKQAWKGNFDQAISLFMLILQDYDNGIINKNQVIALIEAFRSYFLRRSVCGNENTAMAETLITFHDKIDKDEYLFSLLSLFVTRTKNIVFPNNATFIDNFVNREIYSKRNTSVIKNILLEIENNGKKERIGGNQLTVEHIFPQNGDKSDEWREMIGSNMMEMHNVLLHTFGNLTLTGYNSEYSDRSFDEKKNMENGFSSSPLKMNQYIASKESWTPAEIRGRAEQLAEKAVEIWKYPKLNEYLDERISDKIMNMVLETESESGGPGSPYIRLLAAEAIKEICSNLKSYDFRSNSRYSILGKNNDDFVRFVFRESSIEILFSGSYDMFSDIEGIIDVSGSSSNHGRFEAKYVVAKMKDIPAITHILQRCINKNLENNQHSSLSF